MLQLPSPPSCPDPVFESEMLACLPALRRYALSLARDREDAEDLVHDVVVLAIQKRHLWQSGSNLRAWLSTLLHNVFINRQRRRASRVRQVPLEDGTVGADPGSSQEEAVALQQAGAALNCIPAQQKTVLLLISVRGLSYAEAAEVLNVPLGTVRSRLSRARESLRDIMQLLPAPDLGSV